MDISRLNCRPISDHFLIILAHSHLPWKYAHHDHTKNVKEEGEDEGKRQPETVRPSEEHFRCSFTLHVVQAYVEDNELGAHCGVLADETLNYV